MSTPAPEAIEAVAIAIYYQQVGLKPPYPLWENADADEKDNCRTDAQLAYDAMAPIIATQAKAEALREAADALPGLRFTDTGYSDTNGGHRRWLRARATTIEWKSE